jgi:uncharacterized protein YndB with AHSA1/START domain
VGATQRQSRWLSEVDKTTHTIRFERALTAAPERVFEAWTRADHVTHWWDPSGAADDFGR